jgi:hypothetical protein
MSTEDPQAVRVEKILGVSEYVKDEIGSLRAEQRNDFARVFARQLELEEILRAIAITVMDVRRDQQASEGWATAVGEVLNQLLVERGYEPIAKPRPVVDGAETVMVRFGPDEADLLRRAAQATGRTMSGFLREATEDAAARTVGGDAFVNYGEIHVSPGTDIESVVRSLRENGS